MAARRMHLAVSAFAALLGSGGSSLALEATTEASPPGGSVPAPSSAPDRIALLVSTPSGELNFVRSAEIVSFIDRTIEERTDLELDRVDPGAVRECRGRMSCFVQTVRPDYDRKVYFLPTGGMAPFAEHEAYVQRKDLSVARFLLLVSGVGTPAGDALTFTLLDVDRALAWRHERNALDRAAEIALLREATLERPLRVEITRSDELAAVLERLQTELLQPGLSARGHWDPFGRLSIRANVAGAGVYIDDRLVATTGLEPVTIRRVDPGERRLRVEHPDYRTQSRTADVQRAQSLDLRFELEPRPSDAGRIVHAATFWSGLGLVTAGAALVIVGAVDAANAPQLACADCSSRFLRTSTEFSDDPTQPPTEGGPLTVPLGYSLALTGASWSVGALLTDRERVPWVPLLGGLALGAIAYGISEAAR